MNVSSYAQFLELIDTLKDEEISIWADLNGETYPCVNICIKGEMAYLHYFSSENHPGLISRNGNEIEGTILINQEENIEIPSNSVFTKSLAIEGIQDFYISLRRSSKLEWFEL